MSVNLSMFAGAGQQFFDNSGNILSGGKIYTYLAGTTTPYPTYTTVSGATSHANPIVLDSSGRVSAGQIWLTDAVSYKFVLTKSDGTVIQTLDNITGAGSGILSQLSGSSGSSLVGFIQSGTGTTASTVQTKLRETVSVKDFGAVGDGTTDDTAAIQNAINSCITTQKKLFVPVGTYKITSPLLIGKWSGSAWSYASIEIEGEKLPFDVQQTNLSASQIVPTFKDTFAIGVQNGRGVKISKLYLQGQNDFRSSAFTAGAPNSYLLTNSNYVINSCRDSRYSPYAGIVIDPFGTSVPADGGYPGLSSYYVGSAAGSSWLEFDDVSVCGFVAAIVLSPNGTTANCSEISFNNCYLAYNKTGLSICQSQSRNVTWNHGSNCFNLYCFDGNTYGLQQGYAPAIYGCNMSGKYLFNITSRYGSAMPISGIHAESFFSIGYYGVNQTAARYPLTFIGCEFNFFDFQAATYPDFHLYAYSDVLFIGCNFTNDAYSYSSPIRMVTQLNSKIEFSECNFRNVVQNEFYLGTSICGGNTMSWNSIYFNGSSFSDGSSRGNSQGVQELGHRMIAPSIDWIDRCVTPLSSQIKYTFDGSAGDLQLIGGLESDYRVSLGSLSVTTGSNSSFSFTASDGSVVRVGDLIYTSTTLTLEGPSGSVNVSSDWTCIGVVTNVATNVITVSGRPNNFSSGTYTLYSVWWPRIHKPTTVNTTSGSTSITFVSNASSWVAGNKILGSGIPTGAYLTAVVGSTGTLSKAATATASGVRVYDANVQKLTGTAV